jgi:hypothetical protein
MKKLFLITGFLIASFTLFSQADYKPGYIITNDNDTLRGYINIKSNEVNSQRCEFKQSNENEKKIYTPGEIKGYRIEGMKYYISKEVKMDSVSKIIYLEYLVDGIADLYYLKDGDRSLYFIEKNGELYTLTSEEEIVHYTPQSITEERKRGGKAVEYTRQSNKYIGMLNIAFNDCPELKTKINSTGFSYGPLIKITKEYHKKMCLGYECIDYSKSTEKNIFIEPVAGVIITKVGLETSKQTKNYRSYIIGANVRFLPLHSHYVWNLLIGINYSQFRLDEIFRHNLDEAIGIVNPAKIKANYSIISIPISIEYTFPFGKLSPFLMGTLTNCILINDEYESRGVYENLDGSYVLGFPDEKFELKKYHYGLGGGAGLKYKTNDKTYAYLKCAYEYRKCASSSMEIYDYLTYNSIIVTMGFGFRL